MNDLFIRDRKFITVEEVVDFLKLQPEILSVKKKELKGGAAIFAVKINSAIHPARKLFITHQLHDKLHDNAKISVVEEKKR